MKVNPPKPCSNCKYISVTVHGYECSKANYRYSEYGSFWISNECIHDENHTLKASLFEPVSHESLVNFESEILRLRGEVNLLNAENSRLRSLIR